MTAVLHTADVHLTPDDETRLDALEELLALGERRSVDTLTIGGDLFESPAALEQLRPHLRNDLFTDRPYEILLIPGNHDVEAFRGDVFFGDACTVLAEEPFEHWRVPGDGLRITGLPYRERPDDDLLLALQERDPFDGPEALLLHCSLDAPFDDYESGDEGGSRYFPVTTELLGELGFDYYLAGHYHTAHQVALDGGGVFTYPGTPASTSAAETGRRRVSLLDPEEGVTFEPLDTFHRVAESWTVTPGEETAVLAAVEEWASRQIGAHADASVHVDGFIEMDETVFHNRLTAAAGPATVVDETRNVDHVTAHPLFAAFEEELAAMDWDEPTEAAVTERTLEVCSRLAASGEI